MDAETKTVIKNIAQIQVEALTHISKNLEDTDHYLLKKLLQIEEGEIRGVLDNMIKLYSDMIEYPQLNKNSYRVSIIRLLSYFMENGGRMDNR